MQWTPPPSAVAPLKLGVMHHNHRLGTFPASPCTARGGGAVHPGGVGRAIERQRRQTQKRYSLRPPDHAIAATKSPATRGRSACQRSPQHGAIHAAVYAVGEPHGGTVLCASALSSGHRAPAHVEKRSRGWKQPLSPLVMHNHWFQPTELRSAAEPGRWASMAELRS